jgi:hypothetical protein
MGCCIAYVCMHSECHGICFPFLYHALCTGFQATLNSQFLFRDSEDAWTWQWSEVKFPLSMFSLWWPVAHIKQNNRYIYYKMKKILPPFSWPANIIIFSFLNRNVNTPHVFDVVDHSFGIWNFYLLTPRATLFRRFIISSGIWIGREDKNTPVIAVHHRSLILVFCHIKGHLFKLELTDDPTCERCLEEDESATYILCDCEAIAQLRFHHLGQLFMEPSD